MVKFPALLASFLLIAIQGAAGANGHLLGSRGLIDNEDVANFDASNKSSKEGGGSEVASKHTKGSKSTQAPSTSPSSTPTADTTPPKLSCPASIEEEATTVVGGRPAAPLLKFSYAVNEKLSSFTCATPSSTLAFGDIVPNGTPLICTAVDLSGNKASCQIRFFAVDTTPPTITCPSRMTRETDNQNGITVDYTTGDDAVTASDAASTPSIECRPNGRLSEGTTSVACVVTDGAGLTAGCIFDCRIILTCVPDGDQCGQISGAPCCQGICLGVGIGLCTG